MAQGGLSPRLLLPAPTPQTDDTMVKAEMVTFAVDADATITVRAGWSTEVDLQTTEPAHVLQEQRDGLVRLRERLLSMVRELEAENASLRKKIEGFQGYSSLAQQEQEAALAKSLREERGITFREMPGTVYPGKPYVTQQDLTRQGATHYTRQNISRLSRSDGVLGAIVIGDRVLLPPRAVEVLIDREAAAARDPSPRRRPGRKGQGD